MPKVRLAGTVRGERDPNREIRARLLYSLFSRGWDIYNSNGDQRISLSNIERKIIESDAFVFTPGATLEDLFKAVSIFVGYQTLDRHLAGKPTVLLNSDRSWDGLTRLLTHLNGMGTVKQRHEEFLIPVSTPDEVISTLDEVRKRGLPDAGRDKAGSPPIESFETPLPPNHEGNVCVFCSASIEDPAYLKDGYDFGKLLAGSGLGCVSGAGQSGIMGEVVRGAVDAERESAHDADAVRGERSGERMRRRFSFGGRLARADDRSGRSAGFRKGAADVYRVRRPRDLFEERRKFGIFGKEEARAEPFQLFHCRFRTDLRILLAKLVPDRLPTAASFETSP